MHIPYPHALRKRAELFALTALCVALSFVVGIQSAGEVQPFSLIAAGSTQIAGDVDGDGIVTIRDAIVILEIVQGYREATPAQLKADPTGDGAFTNDDAIRLLSTLSLR